MSAPNSLGVQLYAPNGEWVTVGFIRHANEISWFESLPEYWDIPFRPVLGQIFEERGPSWKPSQRVSLPNWFSHLLPEGSIRSEVASALGVNSLREFFILAAIGLEDLPGAVRVLPGESVDEIEVPEEAGYSQDEMVPDAAILKFSLAGMQPKFSVYKDSQRGMTLPARGQAGNWILKLPDGRPGFEGVPEAEYASLSLARAIGIDVPEISLLPLESIAGLPDWAYRVPGDAFAIKRFDRTEGNGRIHAEVLAQILDIPTSNDRFKYRRANFETISSVSAGICGPTVVGEVIDRIVLNVLLGNGDAHLKNWAVIYPNSRTPRLSPLFDVIPTVLYLPHDDLGPKLNGSRDFSHVVTASFDRLAARSSWEVVAARERVRSAVERVVDNWHILGDHLGERQFAELTRRRDGLALIRSSS